MGDFITLDVIDRPRGGTTRALLAVRRHRRPEGCRALIAGTTVDLVASLRLSPRLGRVAVLGVWTHEAAATWSPAPVLAAGSAEHWHVRGELAGSTGDDPWQGWEPDTTGARRMEADEPMLVLIHGLLRTRHLVPFLRDNVGAVARAKAHPGYLGGLGMTTSPSATCSVSAWRSAADSRDFAYGPGGHRTAMDRDLAAERHRTSTFLRIRPTASSGTLDGRDPFAGVLSPAAPALPV